MATARGSVAGSSPSRACASTTSRGACSGRSTPSSSRGCSMLIWAARRGGCRPRTSSSCSTPTSMRSAGRASRCRGRRRPTSRSGGPPGSSSVAPPRTLAARRSSCRRRRCSAIRMLASLAEPRSSPSPSHGSRASQRRCIGWRSRSTPTSTGGSPRCGMERAATSTRASPGSKRGDIDVARSRAGRRGDPRRAAAGAGDADRFRPGPSSLRDAEPGPARADRAGGRHRPTRPRRGVPRRRRHQRQRGRSQLRRLHRTCARSRRPERRSRTTSIC